MNFFKSKYFFDSSIALLKNKWLPFVLGIPLFFCLHHYEGIVFDSRLYLLQVLHSWLPDRFIDDPPFMFGNQDSFGIFTSFYSLIINVMSIDMGTFLFALFAQSLWLVAAYCFIYQFSKKMQIRLWFAPLLFCFILYSAYNMPNDHIFFWRYIENFNASRLHSMAIAILGLGALFGSKKNISLVLFLFGTALHPLTAGWCLPLWLFFYYPKARGPIVIMSALLPLTFLLHRGPFDIYPADWGHCTHDHPVTFLMLWREVVAVMFFGLFVPKFSCNKSLLKFSKAIFWVLLIGFYWSATGGVAKHILIYQVQTWRVEWLFFIFALPIYVYIVYEQISLLRHKRLNGLTLRHISLFLIGFAIFMPASCSGAFFLALALLIVPVKRLCLKYSLLLFSVLCLLSVGVQEFTNVFLLGLVRIPLIGVSDLFRESDNLLLLQFLWIMGIITVCLYKVISNRKGVEWLVLIAFVLLVYLFFPRFQLIPVALTAVILYSRKEIRLSILIPIVLLCVGDCLFCNTGYRETNILNGFPKSILETFVFIVPIAGGMMLFFLRISNVARTIMLFASSFVLTVFAYEGYDKREPSIQQSESYLDLFKDDAIFPQIKNRGKMFYYVAGDFVDESRTQFLTGSYFSETTPIGEALFQGQFEEERKRLNYLFFKEQRGFIAQRGDWQKFVKDSLSKKNILLDRVSFLCSINEITHFVSNMRFKELDKLDFFKMNENEIIFLYGCPNAKD